VHTLEVTPESAELQLIVSPTVQLDVVLKDGDDNVLTGREVEWTSSDEGVATVDENGLVTAAGEGDATITASSGGESDDAAIHVKRAPVHMVGVEPDDFDLVVGGDRSTQQLTVTLLDGNGNELTGRDVSFSALPAGVVTVTDDGLVTAVAAGDATITARSEGIEGEAKVTVAAAGPPAPDQYEPNNLPGDAWDLSQIDQDQEFSIFANFHDPATDRNDWYHLTVNEGSSVCVGGSEDFEFTVSLSDIPEGSDYTLELYSWNPFAFLDWDPQSGNVTETVTVGREGTCGTQDTWEFRIRVRHNYGCTGRDRPTRPRSPCGRGRCP
jgi:hypothetical protein